MWFTTKKYRVSINFYRKQAIFGKTVGWHLWILSEKLNFIETHKNTYTGPFSIIDLEYGGHDQEIQNFGQLLLQTVNFQQNQRLTPMDFEW
jgi:hypothetical protein